MTMTHRPDRPSISRGWLPRREILGALLLGLLLVAPVWAAPVTLNLKDADINALVESMSVLTGKNFIVDPRVKGRVTIISAKPMDEKELYEVFLAVLSVHGFAAVPSGKVIKIVPAAGPSRRAFPPWIGNWVSNRIKSSPGSSRSRMFPPPRSCRSCAR